MSKNLCLCDRTCWESANNYCPHLGMCVPRPAVDPAVLPYPRFLVRAELGRPPVFERLPEPQKLQPSILARIQQHMDIELEPSSPLRGELTKLLAILRN